MGLGTPAGWVVFARRWRNPCELGRGKPTQLGRTSVHPKVAMRILRHSQIALTMGAYAEAGEEEVRDAARQLSEAMGNG